jgi:two-component system, OmpR family, response regulator MprA
MRVLVVEDEAALADAVARGLRREGMAVDVAYDGDSGHEKASVTRYDVVVLDRDLPGMGGDDLCAEIVSSGATTRVLMLTASGTLADKVDGLSRGADDYLAKPFELDELFARLRALLRRAAPTTDGPDRSAGGLQVAALRIDPAARRVWWADTELALSKTEFDLLELMVRNEGIVLDHSTVYERIWGYDFGADSKNLAVYVGYLRRKLAAAGAPPLIHTVRGVGYAVRKP